MSKTERAPSALIHAPHGRDAALAAALLSEAEVAPRICADLAGLAERITPEAAFAVVAIEALRHADLRTLTERLATQPAWSDLPIILLTHRGGGPERNPEAARLSETLGNVSFLERPFHPTTFVSMARSALRGRLRQFEARARLDEVREGAANLRTALTAGRLGSWELRLADLTLTTSADCKRLFGRRPDEAFTYGDLIAAVTEEHRPLMRERVERTIAGHGDYEIEYQLVRPSGEVRWAEIRARLVTDPSGAPLKLVGVSSDITDRKRTEASMRDARDLLEQRVAERTAELAAANARLVQEGEERERMQSVLVQSQKMEAVGQLTGGVAHDFNNLLTIIRSSVDFLRRQDISAARRDRYVEAISQTVDRASKLTGQLLAFARRQALVPVEFDVGAQVESVAELVRPLVGSRITIEVRQPDAPCHAKADVSQFETALINLAVNGRDAMQGEGTLVFCVGAVSELPSVRGHAGGKGNFVSVTVEDSGCGIPADRLSNIFEPFYTTKEVGKGTGLGLSQVFGFAKQSGGEVTVRSEEGRGAAFRLYLPRTESAAPMADPPRTQHQAALDDLRGLRVLVVEDNDAVGQFAVEMLTDLGHRPFRAANAQEAFDALGEDGGGFDAVFSDVMMPGMNGLAMAQLMRERFASLPVLLTSGYSHVLAQEGAHGFELLKKPYSVKALAERLRQVVSVGTA